MVKRSSTPFGSPVKKILRTTNVSSTDAALSALQAKTTRLERKVNKAQAEREVHWFDVNETGVTVPYDVNRTYALLEPGVSTGRDDRLGDSVSPFLIDIHGYFDQVSAATATCMVRVMLVQSKLNFVPSSVATSGAGAVFKQGASINAPLSTFVYDNKNDYTVLYDRTMATSIRGEDNQIKQFRIKKKLSRKVMFAAGTSTADAGQLYLIATSSTSNASSNTASIRFTSRVLFYDE